MIGIPKLLSALLNKSKTGALNSTKSTALRITSFCLCRCFMSLRAPRSNLVFFRYQILDIRFQTTDFRSFSHQPSDI